MKKFIVHLGICAMLTACINTTENVQHFTRIDENCSFVTVHYYDSTIFLRKKDTGNLIRAMNNAEPVGMLKFFPEIHITIHYFRDGSERNFRVRENLFKEKGDHSYKLRNKDYFENLWRNSDEIGLKKYQSLGNNLYRDSEGTIFHQVVDRTANFQLILNDFMRFDTIIGTDTTFYAVKLNQILDLATFKRIDGIEDEHGTSHYEDKNNTYFLRPMAEGGLFHGRRKSWE